MVYLKLNTPVDQNTTFRIDELGNSYLKVPKTKNVKVKKTGSKRSSSVNQYLKYLEWEEDKKKLPIFFTYPAISQNFSPMRSSCAYET